MFFSVSCSQNETLINQCFGISQEGVPNPMNGKDGIKIFLLISIFLLYTFFVHVIVMIPIIISKMF